MKRYAWIAVTGLMSVSLTWAQALGAGNTGASPGGNRTGGAPPDTADGHVVAGSPSTRGSGKTTASPPRNARKTKVSRKIYKKARATPEHGTNSVPNAPREADPHESAPGK